MAAKHVSWSDTVETCSSSSTLGDVSDKSPMQTGSRVSSASTPPMSISSRLYTYTVGGSPSELNTPEKQVLLSPSCFTPTVPPFPSDTFVVSQSNQSVVSTVTNYLQGNPSYNTIPIYTSVCSTPSFTASPLGSSPSLCPPTPIRSSSFVPHALAQRSSMVHRKEKEPDKFDGKSVEWKDFIVQFEYVASWNGWSTQEKAQQLVMCLRGTAQRMLGDLTFDQLHNYDVLTKILSSRFCPVGRESAYRCEFRNRRRQRNESISDYGYALRRLGCLAFPDVPHTYREINVIDQFVNGLGNLDLKKHVSLNHPVTLEAAIALAIEYEAFEGSQVPLVKPIDMGDTDVYRVQAIKADRDSVSKTQKVASKEKGDNSEITDLISSMKDCFEKFNRSVERLNKNQSDRGQGHISEGHRESHAREGRGRGGRPRTYDRDIECYNCHEKGHISRECPSRDDKKSQNKDKREN